MYVCIAFEALACGLGQCYKLVEHNYIYWLLTTPCYFFSPTQCHKTRICRLTLVHLLVLVSSVPKPHTG